MSSKTITTDRKPSITQYFAKGYAEKATSNAVPESASLSVSWSVEKAKLLAAKEDFARASPATMSANKKTRVSSAATAKLPITGFKTILEGTKNAKAPGGRKPKVVFLSHIPVDWILDQLAEINKQHNLNKIFRDYGTIETWLKEHSQTNVPGTPSGSYHFPVRISGPAPNVQDALKVFGLDFARLLAYVEKTSLEFGVYNEYNADIIDQFSFHGAVSVSVGEDTLELEPNVGFEGWVENHPYGQLYMQEIGQRFEQAKYLRLEDATGKEVPVYAFHYAGKVVASIGPKTVTNEYIVTARTNSKTGNVTWVKSSVGESKITPASASNFNQRLVMQLNKIRKSFQQGDDGENTPLESIKLRIENGNLSPKASATRSRVLAEGQNVYAIVPAFTFTDENGTVHQVNYGDIVIAVSTQTNKANQKKAAEGKAVKEQNPLEVLAAFEQVLESLVSASTKRSIVETLRADIIEKQAALRETQNRKKTAKRGAPEGKFYADNDDVADSPESQTVEPVDEPEDEEEEDVY